MADASARGSDRAGKRKAKTPLKGGFVSDHLVEDLRRQIREGELRPGDPVLTVRKLMTEYGISYNSVRRALSQLADEGYLSLEQGRGTFVKGVPAHDRAVAPAPPAAPTSYAPNANSDAQPSAYAPPPATPAAPLTRSTVAARVERRTLALIYPQLTPRLHEIYGYGTILSGVQRQTLENGEALTLLGAHPRKELPTPNELRDGGVDGALLLGPCDAARAYAFSESPLPCVLLDHWPDELALNCVLFDHFSGGYQLAKQLVNAGHVDVGFVRAPSVAKNGAAGERETGCRLALKEEGLELRASHVLSAASPEALAEQVLALSPRPTALVVGQEPQAAALCAALARRGVSVPQHLSIVCFGARRGTSEHDLPELAAARADYAKMGESGVSRLRQLMAGESAGRLRINIPVEFEPGRSLAPR